MKYIVELNSKLNQYDDPSGWVVENNYDSLKLAATAVITNVLYYGDYPPGLWFRIKYNNIIIKL